MIITDMYSNTVNEVIPDKIEYGWKAKINIDGTVVLKLKKQC